MGILKRRRYEHFVREYLACDENAAEAYRRVAKTFPRRPIGNPNSAYVIAHRILKRPEVKRRVSELRTIMAKKADITLDKVLTDVQEAIQMAKAQAKPNDLVNAAMAQAKLVGLLRERIETGSVADYENLESASAILEKLAADVGPEAALALASAFGLNNASKSTDTVVPDSGADVSADVKDNLLEFKPPSGSIN